MVNYRNFDSVIFDIDGTLWDCSRASVVGFNRAYEELGIFKRVDVDLIHYIAGKPSSEYNHILLDGVPEEKQEKLLELFDQYEQEAVKDFAKDSLFEGVERGLQKLINNNLKLFVVSNCGAPYLQAFLNDTGLKHYFTDAECFGNTGLSKAENIKAVIERNHLRHPCYIGDTAGDQRAAKEVGIPFFHAKYGFEPTLPVDQDCTFINFPEITNKFTRSRNYAIPI